MKRELRFWRRHSRQRLQGTVALIQISSGNTNSRPSSGWSSFWLWRRILPRICSIRSWSTINPSTAASRNLAGAWLSTTARLFRRCRLRCFCLQALNSLRGSNVLNCSKPARWQVTSMCSYWIRTLAIRISRPPNAWAVSSIQVFCASLSVASIATGDVW